MSPFFDQLASALRNDRIPKGMQNELRDSNKEVFAIMDYVDKVKSGTSTIDDAQNIMKMVPQLKKCISQVRQCLAAPEKICFWSCTMIRHRSGILHKNQ